MNIVSFLIDSVPLHYYQAELLLFSLQKYACYTKEQILVQCVNRVDKKFIEFLESNHYNYCFVEPYLDKKYCNKIPQLDAFLDKKCDGVFFLDADLFILGELEVPSKECFCAKTVDSANPPLNVMLKIFSAAGVEFPKTIDADIFSENSKTLATNFNGGFYYIPYRYLSVVRDSWRKWAEWLYYHQDLFDTKQQCNHIDQVSMALCIAENSIPYMPLSANNNFPVQTSSQPSSYVKDKEISVLHYHNFLDAQGEIHVSKPIIIADEAIKKANRAIVEKGSFKFLNFTKKKKWFIF